MAFKLLLAAALIALVRAGGPAAYSISSPSGDHASVGSSHEHTVKGLHGTNVVSQYSKTDDTAHSSVHVSSSLHSNGGYAPHHGAGYGYAAPAISHHYAAPALTHGYAHAAPAVLGHSYGHHAYGAPALSHASIATHHHGYVAPAVAHHHGYAAAPASVTHHGFAAPAIAHHGYAAPAIAHHGYVAPAVAHHGAVSYAHQAAPLALGHGYSGLHAPIAHHHGYAAPLAYKAPVVGAYGHGPAVVHSSVIGHGASSSYAW